MASGMADEKAKARIEKQINENLRRVYEETLTEEIPDRFRDLLAKLKEKESGK
ncbi:MAG: transcriptional regulator [Rhodobacteraceae bacterium]|jgi:hemerythrin-like domain-containing protein|nr:transcriptional regulator [Paracoccaceae bacterium]